MDVGSGIVGGDDVVAGARSVSGGGLDPNRVSAIGGQRDAAERDDRAARTLQPEATMLLTGLAASPPPTELRRNAAGGAAAARVQLHRDGLSRTAEKRPVCDLAGRIDGGAAWAFQSRSRRRHGI